MSPVGLSRWGFAPRLFTLLDVAEGLRGSGDGTRRERSRRKTSGRWHPISRSDPSIRARLDEVMRRAAINVVALEPRTDRSAGQGTYLNAMVRAKPVMHARQHLEWTTTSSTARRVSLFAQTTTLALSTLRWLLDHAEHGSRRWDSSRTGCSRSVQSDALSRPGFLHARRCVRLRADAHASEKHRRANGSEPTAAAP